MTRKALRVAAAAMLAISFATSTVGVANADPVKKKIVYMKPAPKVFVAAPRHRYNNRNVALGVAAAVVAGTVIAASAANASDRMSCSQLERRCDNGQDWACRRLEVREDC